MFCSEIGPRLLGIDVKAEAEKVERDLGIDRRKRGVYSAWRPFELRAYRPPEDSRLAGKTVAEAESMAPRAVSLMSALGLAGFVAMIGLSAEPHFIDALREAGLGLFFGGMVVTAAPLAAGLYFGRYVLRLDPLLVLGGLAGAQTLTAALATVQERSGSKVAVLGYSGTVAIGHILLTTRGTVIVRLIAPS
jgi:AspT/YidE/YbjL antiporter-like protein